MHETSKSVLRRLGDTRWATRYLRGEGIDIGGGDDGLAYYQELFPLVTSIRNWDRADGDAQLMQTVSDETYDFVHSSHCLEHVADPYEAFSNWIRITKPGGHIITTIPDEDLYEQGHWPSVMCPNEHQTSWTILKPSSWCWASHNVIEFLYQYREFVEILKIELIDHCYINSRMGEDQTLRPVTESAIEFVVRKRT